MPLTHINSCLGRIDTKTGIRWPAVTSAFDPLHRHDSSRPPHASDRRATVATTPHPAGALQRSARPALLGAGQRSATDGVPTSILFHLSSLFWPVVVRAESPAIRHEPTNSPTSSRFAKPAVAHAASPNRPPEAPGPLSREARRPRGEAAPDPRRRRLPMVASTHAAKPRAILVAPAST